MTRVESLEGSDSSRVESFEESDSSRVESFVKKRKMTRVESLKKK